MNIEDTKIIRLKDLNKLRTAPNLNKNQAESIFLEVENIIYNADWLTIGIMAPSLEKAMHSLREFETIFRLEEMKSRTVPDSEGPIFLKANQKTNEINSRIEYGLGEGIIITCQNNDISIASETFGPFPLDFFNKNKTFK